MKKFGKIFYFMSLSNMTFFLGNSLFILFPVFLKNLGASESEIGLMNNIDKIFVLISAVLIGYIIHKWNRITLLRFGYGILMITYISYLLISSISPIWLIIGIRIIHGIGFSLSMILGSTIIFDTVSSEKSTEAIAIYGISASLSNAISPTLGEYLLSQGISHYYLFILSTIFIFMSFILTFIMARINSGEKPSTESSAHTSILKLYKDKKYLLYSILTFIFGGGFGVIITFLPNFIRTTTLYNYSYFFITYIAVLIILRFTSMRFLETLNKNLLLMIIFSIGIIMNVLLNTLNSLLLFIFISGLYGIVHGILYPVLNAHIVSIVPPDDKGKSNALFTATFNTGMMAFAFCFGFLIDYYETYLVAFNASAIFFLAAIFIIGFMMIGEKREKTV